MDKRWIRAQVKRVLETLRQGETSLNDQRIILNEAFQIVEKEYKALVKKEDRKPVGRLND